MLKHVDFGSFSLLAIATYECSQSLVATTELLLLGEHSYKGALGVPRGLAIVVVKREVGL